MDLWYLPSISLYIKMLIKPFLYKITPEEATKILEDFEPEVRKAFLTKVSKFIHLIGNYKPIT